MEVTTLFGGSGASKDKCFPLLPFLWGEPCSEPRAPAGSPLSPGVTLPTGEGRDRGLGAGGRGTGG